MPPIVETASCKSGTSKVCNDGKTCTDDGCNAQTGACIANNNTVVCDDGNACTTGDVCSGGACKSGTSKVCNDGKACTDDSCDELLGCVNANNTKVCIESCLFKNCTFEFMSCIASGESGPLGCPETFKCLEDPKHKDKFQTISLKCFGAATINAQKQLASFWACGQEPQVDSCLDQIATCFGTNGKATCLQTIQCSEACKDEVCNFECIGKADKDGQAKLDALSDCAGKNCKGMGKTLKQ